MPNALNDHGYDPLGSVEVHYDDGFSSPPVDPPEPRLRMASPVTGEEEVDAIRAVLQSGFLTNGPATRDFEALMAELQGTVHGVAFANGTVALAAMLLAAGIGPGDEVIVPSLTFIATATSVLHVGATPVFADIRPDTFNLDHHDVARRITSRTRAVMPMHYAGQSADLNELKALTDQAGLVLLEDAAQAHGASYFGRPVGSIGAAAMFSFTPTKNVTTGEGAVVTTNDPDMAEQLRLLRNHGMTSQYHHEVLGWNWRLSDIHSAMGCVQLGRLAGILAIKRANAARMAELLAPYDLVAPPVVRDHRDHPYMLYTVLVPADRRCETERALTAVGIESRRYFPPAHHQPLFRHVPDPQLPVTEDVYSKMLSIPFHSRLTDADLCEMAEVIGTTVHR